MSAESARDARKRLFVAAVWRNFVKGLLARRIFPARTPTPPTWTLLYRRLRTAPLNPTNSRHELRRAF